MDKAGKMNIGSNSRLQRLYTDGDLKRTERFLHKHRSMSLPIEQGKGSPYVTLTAAEQKKIEEEEAIFGVGVPYL